MTLKYLTSKGYGRSVSRELLEELNILSKESITPSNV